MKRNWDINELIEHWTLLPAEMSLLNNKIGANRLGFAIMLKFFQQEAQFPNSAPEIPAVVVNYVARLVEVPPEQYREYDWLGRTGWYHRTQIRAFCGFRRATVADARQLVEWLIENILPHSLDTKYLENAVREHLLKLRIEPMTPGRMERLIRSAVRTSETKFFTTTYSKLSPQTRAAIDDLLRTTETADADLTPETPTNSGTSIFHFLNADPGRVSLDSLLQEITKLKQLRLHLHLTVPAYSFNWISLSLRG